MLNLQKLIWLLEVATFLGTTQKRVAEALISCKWIRTAQRSCEDTKTLDCWFYQSCIAWLQRRSSATKFLGTPKKKIVWNSEDSKSQTMLIQKEAPSEVVYITMYKRNLHSLYQWIWPQVCSDEWQKLLLMKTGRWILFWRSLLFYMRSM